MTAWLLWGAMGCGAVMAQPVIDAVTNAADYSLTVAPGSLAALFGRNLAPSVAKADTLPWPTQLNTVSITINGVAAPLYYVSPTQINFQIPRSILAGTRPVVVTVGGQPSATVQCLVEATAAGIFQWGTNRAVAQNHDFSLNESSNPESVGSWIVLYLTGVGATTPAVADGEGAPASPLAIPTAASNGGATATIGDVDAPVMFIGLTPGSAGLAQVNIRVPALPSGEYPLRVSLGGRQSTSGVVSVRGSEGGFPVQDMLKLVGRVTLPTDTTSMFGPSRFGLWFSQVAKYRNFLYVCRPANTHVVDVSDPAAPLAGQAFGAADLSGQGGQRWLNGECGVNAAGASPFLYLVLNNRELPNPIVAYDLSDPSRPAKASSAITLFRLAGGVFNGAIGFFNEQDFEYSNPNWDINWTLGRVAIFDYSNPLQPRSLAMSPYSATPPATNMYQMKYQLLQPSAGVLYAASTTWSAMDGRVATGALDVMDVSDTTQVRGTAQITVPGTGVLHSLAATGNRMLAVGSTTRISSPGFLTNTGQPDFPFTGSLTLTVFDISNAANPVMKGNTVVAAMKPNGCRAVALGQDFYALSCGAPDRQGVGPNPNGSLVLVDARDAMNPVAYTYSTIYGLGGLTISGEYLYAATAVGANIYKIQLP